MRSVAHLASKTLTFMCLPPSDPSLPLAREASSLFQTCDLAGVDERKLRQSSVEELQLFLAIDHGVCFI